jgi:SH3-like domain-containing protein
MKRLLLLSLLIPALALAEADGPDFFKVSGVASDDALNVHAEAHVKSKVIGEIAPGMDCLKNLGCKGGLTMNESMTLSKEKQAEIERKRPRWCKIDFDGIQGWVYAQYISEGSCSNPDNYKMK